MRRVRAGEAREPVQSIGRGQDHAHLVPGSGQRMAEGVDGRGGVWPVAVVRREKDTRGAERHEGLTGTRHAHPDGGRGIVPGAARDDRGRGQTPAPRQFRPQGARDIRPLDQPRHRCARQVRTCQKLVRPVARPGVEPARPGGVGHLGHMLTRQPEAEVVLRQEHPRHAGEDGGLVRLHPGELRRGKAGEDDVAADPPPDGVGVHRRGFRVAARVVPEDAGSQHLVRGVEERGAVHLARKPDPAHRRQPDFGCERIHHRLGGGDPVGGGLFRPAGLRAADRQRRAGLGHDALRVVDQQALEARRPEVEAKVHVRPPGARASCRR